MARQVFRLGSVPKRVPPFRAGVCAPVFSTRSPRPLWFLTIRTSHASRADEDHVRQKNVPPGQRTIGRYAVRRDRNTCHASERSVATGRGIYRAALNLRHLHSARLALRC